MRKDLPSGILLIAGALAYLAVMAFHPTGGELMAAGSAAAAAHRNVAAHSLALFATPALFLGLLGLTRRLGPSDLATAGLVAFGFGSVAVLSAAVMSGFVATETIAWTAGAEGAERELYHAFLDYTGALNQAYTRVYVVGSSVAFLLWSAAILRTGRLARAAGVVGALAGAGVLVAFLAGHLHLDVHGFGILVLVQSAWLVWVGVLLCRDGRRARTGGAAPAAA